jgi:hypothetical protein
MPVTVQLFRDSGTTKRYISYMWHEGSLTWSVLWSVLVLANCQTLYHLSKNMPGFLDPQQVWTQYLSFTGTTHYLVPVKSNINNSTSRIIRLTQSVIRQTLVFLLQGPLPHINLMTVKKRRVTCEQHHAQDLNLTEKKHAFFFHT